ncbi:armadillo-like helical domain containing protein 1 [Cynoglossus semilaevis]|uniref:Armadillo like helical domain containing 1 n=1 Tax=Cynoglossus semilaevis TaxID=244447 RepID=A0A3P8W6G7_CYNSE|nr:uncharacterized protein C1orf228 homolog [Cynoglossus semilaevis]
MSSQEESADVGRVLAFLREWDRGDNTVRSRILKTFLTQSSEKTFYQLECEFAQISSLFLARLTTWMRLTYMFGTHLGLQLKSVQVFLSASGHDQFLMEFLEDGGVLTLLDILSHTHNKEKANEVALRLLLTVSNAGRKYKEFICESRGVKVIAECLTKSTRVENRQTAVALLESLSHGNPKHQNQIYKTLITVMDCSCPNVQHLVLHTLHIIQSKMKTAHESIVEPLLNVLKSLHLEVQDEAINLILLLKSFEVRPLIVNGLVSLLKPAKEEEVKSREITEDPECVASLPVFMQQAAAAKAIRLLAEGNLELSREFLSLGVIEHLLFALGNHEHTDAQVQASLALEHFVRSFPAAEERVRSVMGYALFTDFMTNPKTLYMNLDEKRAETLQNNMV